MHPVAFASLTLLAWAVANGVPHLAVRAAGRRIHYELPTLASIMLVENGIMLMNLAAAVWLASLPAVGVAGAAGGSRSVWSALGWRFDAVAMFWGLAGLAAVTVWSGLVGRLTPRQIIYGPLSARSGRGGAAFAALSLLTLPALCEETMFRGLIQGATGRAFGPVVGIALAAALYGLRHLPADLYWARVHGARWPGWLNRILELYGAAIIFGLARHLSGSTFASWIAHEGMAVVIARQFLPAARKGK